MEPTQRVAWPCDDATFRFPNRSPGRARDMDPRGGTTSSVVPLTAREACPALLAGAAGGGIVTRASAAGPRLVCGYVMAK
jgi:hypothetical protein